MLIRSCRQWLLGDMWQCLIAVVRTQRKEVTHKYKIQEAVSLGSPGGLKLKTSLARSPNRMTGMRTKLKDLSFVKWDQLWSVKYPSVEDEYPFRVNASAQALHSCVTKPNSMQKVKQNWCSANLKLSKRPLTAAVYFSQSNIFSLFWFPQAHYRCFFSHHLSGAPDGLVPRT